MAHGCSAAAIFRIQPPDRLEANNFNGAKGSSMVAAAPRQAHLGLQSADASHHASGCIPDTV